MSNRGHRVQDVPGYMLHASAWRETSLIIQAFSREHGIVPMVGRGAKRPHSVLRPVLNAFQPLLLSWTGAAEVKTLTRAESAGIVPLQGRALMSAWYMNELLMRLLPREDAHPVLYDAYETALSGLSAWGGSGSAPEQPATLRRFEWTLLQETGYGLDGPEPEFDNPDLEPALRQRLRARLDDILDRPLQTRRVMLALHRGARQQDRSREAS